MTKDIVRVLRILEYIGPRDRVEDLLDRSIRGTRRYGAMSSDVVQIRAATIGTYPEIMTQAELADCEEDVLPETYNYGRRQGDLDLRLETDLAETIVRKAHTQAQAYAHAQVQAQAHPSTWGVATLVGGEYQMLHGPFGRQLDALDIHGDPGQYVVRLSGQETKKAEYEWGPLGWIRLAAKPRRRNG